MKKIKKYGKKLIMGLGLSAFILGIGENTFADSLQERRAKEVEQRLILNQATNNGLKLINSEEAKNIAIKTAGIDPAQVQYTKIKLEQEDDYRKATNKLITYVYEVEFLHDGLEYEFDIDAETSQILKSKVDSWLD